jgi:hypothetical protein
MVRMKMQMRGKQREKEAPTDLAAYQHTTHPHIQFLLWGRGWREQ